MIVSIVMPWFHRAPITAPDRPAVEATDRSISPETTSRVIGRAISAIGRVLPIRKDRLRALPKPSTKEKDSSSRTIEQGADDRVPPSGGPGLARERSQPWRAFLFFRADATRSATIRSTAMARSSRMPLMASTQTELTPRAGSTLLMEVSSRAPSAAP